MARKGRELEKLVAALEKLLSTSDIEIRSPDFIRGINSGSRREIDVSLRQKIGSSDILVILECRDRKDKEDVAWIEQLAEKKRDVQANSVVGVSSSGFSSTSVDYARRLGVDLRTIENLNLEDIHDWFQAIDVLVQNRHFTIKHIGIYPHSSIELSKRIRWQLKMDTPFIKIPTGELLSANDLFHRIINKFPEIYEGVETSKTETRKFKVNLLDELFARTPEADVQIGSISFEVELQYETWNVLPSQILQYSKDGEPLIQIVSFETSVNEQDIRLRVHHVPDKGINVSAIINSPENEVESE